MEQIRFFLGQLDHIKVHVIELKEGTYTVEDERGAQFEFTPILDGWFAGEEMDVILHFLEDCDVAVPEWALDIELSEYATRDGMLLDAVTQIIGNLCREGE